MMKYFCPEHGPYFSGHGTDRDPGCSVCDSKPVPKEEWEAMMSEVSAARDKDAPALEPFLAFAHWLRERGWKTSELCQELIKADVEESLK